ncbi:LOW QUALITY PROTEIN: mitochondrial import inner membrane translocase subunit Tim17-B-like [Ctenocephalides felis]|uniref:LOW QUALITY PROTEIN: mitochondrial import inner membrane translocase subunit Tim17-B-like n=1 Tax=Ctenocephalides felis TaxID=7515 RepID=UPI000E6E59D8|nr:LOW QUALITY PROTEIN: mitochondrial import inner membrane translocase subunit Tim17-B-like [Ctenocephalides felis]
MEEYSREPCPWRIVDDCGGAFAMGCIGGGLFQSIRGFRNAPSGFGRRLAASVGAIKSRSPIIAGNFAIWGGMFSTIDCALVCIRKKESVEFDRLWSPNWGRFGCQKRFSSYGRERRYRRSYSGFNRR